jgi:hypothetical protein
MRNMKYTSVCIIILTGFINISAQPVKLWETDTVYKAPESVAYDNIRGFLYVSNYGQSVKPGGAYGNQSISKANLRGEIVDAEWIGNLTTPTGICIFKDILYIVERFGVVKYDLEADKIADKFYIPQDGFLNDVTVAPDTSIFVSVSDKDIIYKIKNGKVEEWLNSEKISKPNGILYDNGKLIIGVNADSKLKAVNISDKEITDIAHLAPGIIDGIKKCGEGWLVSHFEGNLYLIEPSGQIKELLNTRNEKKYIADFEYIRDKGLIIVPDLWGNRLSGYQYKSTER